MYIYSTRGPGFYRKCIIRPLRLLFAATLVAGILTTAGPALGQDEVSVQSEISYPFLEKLIETAHNNYPRQKLFEARVRTAELEVKRTKLSYLDIFNASYFYTPSNRNNVAVLNPNMLTGYQFGIFASLGALFQKPTQIKQARSDLRAAEHLKDEYYLNLEADVKRRYFEYVKAVALFRALSQSVLDAQSMVEDVKYRFEKGEVKFEDYNRASIEMTNRLQAKITFESDVLIAKSSLEELLGKKLEEVQ